MIDTKELWERAVALIKKKDGTIGNFCKRVNIEPSLIVSARSLNRNPKLNTLVLLAEELDTSLDYLCFGKSIERENGLEKDFLRRYFKQPLEVRTAIDKLLNLELKESNNGGKEEDDGSAD